MTAAIPQRPRRALRRPRPWFAAFACLLAWACAPRGPAPGSDVDGSPRGPMGAPFVMSLDGVIMGDGAMNVRALVDVRTPLAAPLIIELAAPAGATIAEGRAKSVVATPREGARVERRWRIVGARGEGVSVTARQRVEGRAGATATKSFPPARDPDPPRWAPIPPTALGGVEVREAVTLDPPSAPAAK